MELLITILGYVFIWVAVDIAMKEGEEIKYKGKWWLIVILIATGTHIVKYAGSWL